MTKDEALTMIIASIAMEELALSHIVNAEGEKIQYILGTLPGKQKLCASTQEILAVNQSVKELLDTVMNSQMLLKGKLEKALEAGRCLHAPGPEPPCPSRPEPPCPDGPCRVNSMIQLAGRCSGLSWSGGCLLSWICQERRGSSLTWDEKSPALVSLDAGKIYALDYTINVRGPYPKDGTGAILTRLTPCGAFSGALPLYYSTKCLECRPLTLHYSTVLFPQDCREPRAELSLLLSGGGSLFVEQAVLNLTEIG